VDFVFEIGFHLKGWRKGQGGESEGGGAS